MRAVPRRRAATGGALVRQIGLGGVVALAGLLGLRFLTADDGYPALLLLRGDLRSLRAEIRELEQANEHLRRAIHALRHDTYAVEKIAREDLDLAAPGEVLYLFPAELGPAGSDRAEADR